MAESQVTKLKNQQWINRVWYERSIFSWFLLPLSGLYAVIIYFRKKAYVSIPGWQKRFSRPVIVVGNITVGGTGKTPMVIFLCQELKRLGYKPGVASRGYGGGTKSATLVNDSHDATRVGDEPVLIFRRTQVPVMVGSNRVEVINDLIQNQRCDVVICDDGLQDYRIIPQVEILMVDGNRRFGNKRLLPAGPLRENLNRIFECNFCVVTGRSIPEISGDDMRYQTHELRALNEPDKTLPLGSLHEKTVHAVAGIANPQRFFDLLTAHGINTINHACADHAHFSRNDLQFPDNYPVLITEKDAVKCSGIDLDNVWYLPVSAQLPDTFITRVQRLLRADYG